MKKRVLILGGFGFMGTNINKAFENDDKYIIFNESRRTNCDMRNLSQLKEKLIDIDPDIIIDAAAIVGSLNYLTKYAADVVFDNSLMYLNLYQAVSSVNKDIIIINPISNCAYPSTIDVQKEELFWDGALHHSIESFGMPKRLGFTVSECYKKQFGVKTVNLIIPNSYGENDYTDSDKTHAMNGIVMRMIKSMRNLEKEFVVWGTGTPIREWVYMPDVGRLFKHIIDNELFDLPNPINVGQENGISIIDTVKIIKDMLEYDTKIILDTTKQDGAPIKIVGAELFKKHFPDFIFTDYKEGIKNTIKYYEKLI